MPVVSDVPMPSNASVLLRHERIRKYTRARPGLKDVLVELLRRVEDEYLLKPAIAYELYPLNRVAQERFRGEGVMASSYDAFLAPLPAKCSHFAAVVCTIGPSVEEEMADYFENRRFSRAILLDSIGNAALDALCKKARQFVTSQALQQGLFGTGISSQDKPVSLSWGQCGVLELVPAEEIGVTVTSRGLVFPQKSAWMVIGLQSQPSPLFGAKDYVCAVRQGAAVTVSVR